jgi:hypothetical protein
MTRTDLQHDYEVKYSWSISRGWVDSFILSHRVDAIETKNTARENPRLKVPLLF